jgi:hypothetical protein
MKKLILLLLLTTGLYAQEHVYNVQWYCVDEAPFKKGDCDISGNEYSFVFLDTEKEKVVFFFTSQKMEYKIVNTVVGEINPDFTVYTLEDVKGQIEMRLNKAKTKMEFIYPNYHIYLTTGNSTKLATPPPKRGKA